MPAVNFAIIVDGEVVGNVTYPSEMAGADKFDAIYSSEPKFVRTTERVEEGLFWDGNNFVSSL